MALGLRLLGPLALLTDDAEIDLGGSRQRIVIAVLALNANRVTAVDHLIDAVWSTDPPNTARAQIQICISRLRKVFLDAGVAATIRTRDPGYLMEIPVSELDTAQFTALTRTARAHVEAGRKSEAVAALRNALALWQGPALSGVRSDLVRRGAALLEDSRLAALIERIGLDLELGKHEEIIGELTSLVVEHPLHERFHEQLVLALYRSSRQAEALEACRRVRETLVEELGIDPGERLQQLERAILNRDASLDLPAQGGNDAQGPAGKDVEAPNMVPRRLPASIGDFTGRDRHRTEIKDVLSAEPGVKGYGTRIVAIAGKGGVGKTTLAVRVAHELRDAYPDGHLYGVMESPTGVSQASAVLARFLRALGVNGGAIPEDPDERADMYRSRLSGKRVLVVLDGATSEDQVMPLLPAGPGCAVLVTSRTRLSGLPGAHLVSLEEFDVELSMEMLAKIVGEDRMRTEYDAAVQLVEFCGGLPLALRIAGARLACSSPGCATPCGASTSCPTGAWSCGRASACPTRRCPPTASGCSGSARWPPRPTSRSGSPPRCSTSTPMTPRRWWRASSRPSCWTPCAIRANASGTGSTTSSGSTRPSGSTPTRRRRDGRGPSSGCSARGSPARNRPTARSTAATSRSCTGTRRAGTRRAATSGSTTRWSGWRASAARWCSR
jgi:DNA-binding SARP family transcriptional activator